MMTLHNAMDKPRSHPSVRLLVGSECVAPRVSGELEKAVSYGFLY